MIGRHVNGLLPNWDGVIGAHAAAAAKQATLALLATLKREVGDLGKVKRIVRVGGFVNGTDDFQNQPKAMNGCSDLLVEVFGPRGVHARSVLGASSLRGGLPVSLKAVVEATHITGDWTVVFLLLSLALTPARAVFDFMPLMQIRRRIGVAAALYAVLHLLIYAADQKWNLVVVAVEIAKRFYLTIGFVALLMMVALAVTSTDGWQRRLKLNWKRLHRLAYPAAVLAILHFFIQSKANVGEATVAAGLFAWLMVWRALPQKLAVDPPSMPLPVVRPPARHRSLGAGTPTGPGPTPAHP